MKRLVGILLVESSLLGLLHRASLIFPVDWSNLAVWMQFTPPDEILMGVLRHIALALTYWLVASTAIFALGTVAQWPRLVRSVEWATLPVVQNAARRAMALSLLTSTLTPAVALAAPVDFVNLSAVRDEDSPGTELGQGDQQPGAVIVGVTDGGAFIPPGATIPRPSAGEPSVPTPRLSGPRVVPSPPAPLLPLQTPSNEVATPDETGGVHLVVAGDNLWTIAIQHLPDAPADVTDQNIATYWGRIVELNRPNLTSQNPDLIFPGEVIELPLAEG